MTRDDLAARIEKVDKFYAARTEKIDEFYGKRVDALTEKVEMLQAQLAQLSTRLQKLERYQWATRR